ncbi:hypothetical protein [Pedobacter sp. MR22-3]|uniref:hypothetical protein n=1 Tax=Pedobacter sp. MR22-3 TaxID=2994552 RepID=UPI00224868E7|nr:hypothetical protein [Pedobacter sp. MR22-3]MCX2584284.1 hypothetical protein [Pedobacter sp. MR22-3]
MSRRLIVSLIDENSLLEFNEIDWTELKKNARVVLQSELPKEDVIQMRDKIGSSHCLFLNSIKFRVNEALLRHMAYLDIVFVREEDLEVIDLEACKNSDVEVIFIPQLATEKEIADRINTWAIAQTDLDPKFTIRYHQDGEEVYKILKDKGVAYLYHANTLSTSQTFIEEGALLSRNYVEKNKLLQTEQDSDDKDKKYGIWDDVFLDGVDNHVAHSRDNIYGPVLFLLKPEILLELGEHPLLVTQFNPQHWHEIPTWKRRYIYNLNHLEQNYKTFQNISSRMMFTIRGTDKHINLRKYLTEIIVDPSEFTVRGIPMGEFLQQQIRKSLDDNGLSSIAVTIREHTIQKTNCSCFHEYNVLKAKEPPTELKKRLKPKNRK